MVKIQYGLFKKWTESVCGTHAERTYVQVHDIPDAVRTRFGILKYLNGVSILGNAELSVWGVNAPRLRCA